MKSRRLWPGLADAVGIAPHPEGTLTPFVDDAEIQKILGSPDAEACAGCERIERTYGDALRVIVSKTTNKVLAVYICDQPLWGEAK